MPLLSQSLTDILKLPNLRTIDTQLPAFIVNREIARYVRAYVLRKNIQTVLHKIYKQKLQQLFDQYIVNYEQTRIYFLNELQTYIGEQIELGMGVMVTLNIDKLIFSRSYMNYKTFIKTSHEVFDIFALLSSIKNFRTLKLGNSSW